MTNKGSASTQQRASAPISQLSHPDFQTSEPELKPRPAVLRGVSSRDPQRFAASPTVLRESPSIVLTSLLKTSLVLVPATNNSSELYDRSRTMPAGSSSMGEIFQRHQPDVAGSVGFTPKRVPTH